jgi:hypothetical protein
MSMSVENMSNKKEQAKCQTMRERVVFPIEEGMSQERRGGRGPQKKCKKPPQSQVHLVGTRWRGGDIFK